MLHEELSRIVVQDRLIHARVVPIPMSASWCIDALFKDVIVPGSRTEVLEAPAAHGRGTEIVRFGSLDAAARELCSLGVTEFEVDVADAISFVSAGATPARPEGATEAA